MPEERRVTFPMLMLFSLPCIGCVGSLLSALLALVGGAALHFGWLGLAAVLGLLTVGMVLRAASATLKVVTSTSHPVPVAVDSPPRP